MRTKDQIKSELLATNPSKKYMINDVEFEQTDEEFDNAINNVVDMIYESESNAETLATAKAAAEAKLAALGLTADDLKALGLS